MGIHRFRKKGPLKGPFFVHAEFTDFVRRYFPYEEKLMPTKKQSK